MRKDGEDEEEEEEDDGECEEVVDEPKHDDGICLALASWLG